VSLIARIVDEQHGDVAIVTVAGEIDSSNATEIAGRMRAAVSNHGNALIVDLTPTTYIDSAGINALFLLGGALRERQQELHVVVAAASPIARMLAIVGLERAVPTHATREAALDVVGVQ
jgi:anti-sigma B factor antagonist